MLLLALSAFLLFLWNMLLLYILAAGVLPLPSHVAAIQDFPRPTIIKKLQAFLGIVNFYRRFLPSIACTLRPLTDTLRGGRKG